MDLLRVALALGILLVVALLAAARQRLRARGYSPMLARLPRGAVDLRAPLTAVYFTSPLCEACKETPGVVRAASDDVALAEVSVHERGDLVRALGVRETPTLLLVDATGRILYARAGNPTREELRARVRDALSA